ncbi:MAG: hypothetical protein HOI95_22935 [Chromatiales bacterium]|jgi:hypothetical protein|nr:hypothetical protein [Chromatiales bacterium]
MLERYQRWAGWLKPLRWVFLLGVGVGLGFFVHGVFSSDASSPQTRLMLPIVGTLWALSLLLFLQAFDGTVPTHEPTAPWWTRVKVRVKRGVLHLFAGAIGLMTLAIVGFSFRAVSVMRLELGW